MIREERLSQKLDEAIEQQHFARVRFAEACQKVALARKAYEIETGRSITVLS